MIQYFKDILTTFSITQRIWALLILVTFGILFTFGSQIIDAVKPDPTQQSLVVNRQKKQIIFLNKQLDSSTSTIDSLTNQIIQSQNDCSRKRFQSQQDMNREIDSLIGLITPKKVRAHHIPRMPAPPQDSMIVTRDEVIEIKTDKRDDKVNMMISGLKHLKKKLNK